MKETIDPPVVFELLPALAKPLRLCDNTHRYEEFIAPELLEGFLSLALADPDQGVEKEISLLDLSMEEIERLAAGEELRTPLGDYEESGRVRLLRGHEDGVLKFLLLEFLPDVPHEGKLDFRSWFQGRYREASSCGDELRNEDLWM